jgi:hypothetical protein
MGHAEGHVGLFGLNLEFFKQSTKLRIGIMIENHESRINRQLNALFFDRDGIGMTAQIIRCLKDGDVILLVQKVSTTQSGDAGANDRKSRTSHDRKK